MKNGTIWHFFRALFPSTWRTSCLQMLCLPGFGTHANTQNLPDFRAFPASIQEHCPPKCLFFTAMLNCQIVPALPSYRGPFSLRQQNYQNNYFHAKVGKDLPKQFTGPVSVGKLDVGNYAFSNTATPLQARKNLKYFQGGSKSVNSLPD